VIQITYYGVYCRPFSQYWALPVGNLQCATYQHYSITQAVFNISSDVMMLAVPIPLVRRAQIPLKRKFLLIGVFSLGIFVIIAAILNKYFNFSSPLTTTYMIWYIRESSTAIYVTNLMCWWPLLRKFFGLRAFSGLSSGMNAAGTPGVGSGKGFSNLGSSTTMHSRIREFKQRLADTKNSSAMMGEDDTIFRSTGSEEAINKPNTFQNHREETDSGSARGDAVPLEIWHKQEYHVEKSAAVLESPVDTKKFDHKSSGGSNYNATVDITSLPDRKGSP